MMQKNGIDQIFLERYRVFTPFITTIKGNKRYHNSLRLF